MEASYQLGNWGMFLAYDGIESPYKDACAHHTQLHTHNNTYMHMHTHPRTHNVTLSYTRIMIVANCE